MKNTKLVIDICSLFPESWTVENITNDLVKVYYINKGRGNSPNKLILPKRIIVDENFVAGIAMYLGDGSLNLVDLNHLSFISIDKDMVKFMLKFFKEHFKLQNSNLRYYLRYKNEKKNSIKLWAEYLGVSGSRIKIYQRDRSTKESFTIQIGGKILRNIFAKIVQEVMSLDFEKEKNLRRAFLRGLFASEGGIGIQFIENYLAYVAFHLSYEKEEELAFFVQKLLMFEEIESNHLTRKNKGERYIQITGWNNYYKLFKIGLFDLSERKNIKFLKFLNSRTFYCKITLELHNKLLERTNPHKISVSLNHNYARISKSLKKKSIETTSLFQISKLKGLDNNEVRNHIFALGMRGTSKDIVDKEFINYVIDTYLPEKIKNKKTWLP